VEEKLKKREKSLKTGSEDVNCIQLAQDSVNLLFKKGSTPYRYLIIFFKVYRTFAEFACLVPDKLNS
jgi:hypothetical protein